MKRVKTSLPYVKVGRSASYNWLMADGRTLPFFFRVTYVPPRFSKKDSTIPLRQRPTSALPALAATT
jgi:hypothetical protein